MWWTKWYQILYCLHWYIYKLASSSTMRGCGLVLADTLRRLSISSVRMKSNTGFLGGWLINVPSLSPFTHGSVTTWKSKPTSQKDKRAENSFIKPEKHTNLWNIQRVHNTGQCMQKPGWRPQWVSRPEITEETEKLHHNSWKLRLQWCISAWLVLSRQRRLLKHKKMLNVWWRKLRTSMFLQSYLCNDDFNQFQQNCGSFNTELLSRSFRFTDNQRLQNILQMRLCSI